MNVNHQLDRMDDLINQARDFTNPPLERIGAIEAAAEIMAAVLRLVVERTGVNDE